MKVWFICFILLFGAAELLQWAQQFSLPLPVFILGGAFLAVISNFDKLTHLPFHPDYQEPDLPQSEAATVQPAQTTAAKARSTEAISFEIRKPFKPKD